MLRFTASIAHLRTGHASTQNWAYATNVLLPITLGGYQHLATPTAPLIMRALDVLFCWDHCLFTTVVDATAQQNTLDFSLRNVVP